MVRLCLPYSHSLQRGLRLIRWFLYRVWTSLRYSLYRYLHRSIRWGKNDSPTREHRDRDCTLAAFGVDAIDLINVPHFLGGLFANIHQTAYTGFPDLLPPEDHSKDVLHQQ